MAPHELRKKVVAFHVVERPLRSSTSNPDPKTANLVPHEGGVATTADGQMYLIEKGVAPNGEQELQRIGGDKGSRILKLGSKIPSEFRIVKEVAVKNIEATLEDLLEASGIDYSLLCRNCWNSTKDMQSVLDQELHLPWQMKLGMDVGIVGVIAMALFVFGKLLLGQAVRN